MKILLVKPYPELLIAKRVQQAFLLLEPLELEILAGSVPKEDEVEILDLNFEKKPVEAFKEKLNFWKPDLIGLTGFSSNASVVKHLAKITKQVLPGVVTVVGGIHATIIPADYATQDIDVIVRGEGGTVFPEILRRYKNKEKLTFGDGVISPGDAQFKSKVELPPPKYPAIETIPLPRRDLVDRSRYFCIWTSSPTRRLKHLFPQVASFRTSIGCAFKCSFCVVHFIMGGKYLQRTPEDVVKELELIKEEHIYFVDDEMFLNIERARRIAELILEKGIKKKYISWARADTIVANQQVFKLWKEAGLSTVYVGLESLDKKQLDDYNKKTDVEINYKAIEILKGLGVTLHSAFIALPDFTVEDFRRLQREVIRISPAEATFTVLSPAPGTAVWHNNKDKFICDPFKYYDCMHTLLPTRLPLKTFYKHFARLTELSLRFNPLRMNKIRLPLKDFIRAIIGGLLFIIALHLIPRDYQPVKK
jgi:radical SAM superfamily enzyme YgiQ (UPF0313 family)